MADSVNTRRRQKAVGGAADVTQMPGEAWPAPVGCTARQACLVYQAAVVGGDQISVCSAISKASSTSMPRYRTVYSSL